MSKFNRENIVKKIFIKTTKIIFLFLIGISAFIVSVTIFSEKTKKILAADTEIETARLRNAIESYKIRTGEYPNLAGNENNLYEVKSFNEEYTFELFYGDEKIYEIPGNISEGIEKTNRIVSVKNNKGGWVYDIATGEISPNIED